MFRLLVFFGALVACRSKAERLEGTYRGTGAGSIAVADPRTNLTRTSQQTFAAPLVIAAKGDQRVSLQTGECALDAEVLGGESLMVEPGQSCTVTVDGLGAVAVGPVGGNVTFAGERAAFTWGAQHRTSDGQIVQVSRSFEGLRGPP